VTSRIQRLRSMFPSPTAARTYRRAAPVSLGSPAGTGGVCRRRVNRR